VGLKRKYRVFADDGAGRPGEQLAYAEKHLKMADEITLYRDRQRGEVLLSVRESSQGWLAALTGFEVFDGAGHPLGSFGMVVRQSLDRTTWQLDQPGIGRFVGTERSRRTAWGRRLLGLGGVAGEIIGALVRVHYDFTGEGGPAFSIEKPKLLDDWYRLTIEDSALDADLLLALVIAMETRQR
jgi:hypothetical protein